MSGAVKEADLLARVTDVAQRYGFKVWHVPAPMRWTSKGWVGAKEAAGLADLILIHDAPPRLIFAELKGSGGSLSDAQREFLQAAKKVAEHSFGEAVLDSDREWDSHEGVTGHFPRTLGVYVVTPETEEAFVQVLRSKVLS